MRFSGYNKAFNLRSMYLVSVVNFFNWKISAANLGLAHNQRNCRIKPGVVWSLPPGSYNQQLYQVEFPRNTRSESGKHPNKLSPRSQWNHYLRGIAHFHVCWFLISFYAFICPLAIRISILSYYYCWWNTKLFDGSSLRRISYLQIMSELCLR